MRTSILCAAFLGLFAAGCAGDLSGTGDTGGDDTQEGVCGDGTVGSGETCDDANSDAGDGCSATCQLESATPQVAMSIDKPTVATELKSVNMLTVTLSGAGGFSGVADVTAKAVDGAGAPIVGWTVTLDKPSVTLPENGTDTLVATLDIASDSRVLTGSIVVEATSSVGTASVTSAVTAAKQVTLNVQVVNNDCMYPAGNLQIVTGTTVRFYNPNTVNFVIHSNGGGAGVPHQGPGAAQSPDDPVTEPDTAYARVSSGGGATFAWYCHDLGPDLGAGNPTLTIVP